MGQKPRARIHFYEDSNFGKSDRRFYEDRLRSGRVRTASGLILDLAVVADGIGGESAGERAAEMVIDEVFDCTRTSRETDIPLILQNAIEFANAKVYLEAQNERHKRDMGSTVVVAAVHENKLYIANVGDSRVYLVRDKQIRQLTVDHTWANEMIRSGTLTPEQAEGDPQRDDLMRSIGYEPQVRVDLGLYYEDHQSEQQARKNQGLPLTNGDQIVLCTDGLIKARRTGGGCFVEPGEIVQIISDAPPGEAAKLLVDKALERKTDDNVSVVVMELARKLPFIYIPKPARIAFGSLLLVGLMALAFAVPSLRRPPVAPTLPPVEISQNQAYVSQIRDTQFEFIPIDNQARAVLDGEFIDFLPGALLRTGNSKSGYAFIGLPGRGELFLGPNTEVKLISSDETGVVIQLDDGVIILNLPEDFPEGRRLTNISPSGARTWISDSKMCAWAEKKRHTLHMDCVEDRCGYLDKSEQIVEAGYHVDFTGRVVSGVGIGLQPEACQFVPGAVPLSTATITPTRTTVLSTKQVIASATARAKKQQLGLPSPTPVRPSATPVRTATAILPTNTLPPTATPVTPSATIPPTATLTPVPTDTPVPTATEMPTNPPPPTETPVPPTDTPQPSPPTNTPPPPDTDTPVPSDTPVIQAIPSDVPTNAAGDSILETPTATDSGAGSTSSVRAPFEILLGMILVGFLGLFKLFRL